MIVTLKPRPVDPVLQAQTTVRAVALLVAGTATSMFSSGRWSNTWPMARELQELAVRIAHLHLEIGEIAERSFAERRVEAMAQAAHQIIIEARRACDAGQAALAFADDLVLVDPQVEAVLISAYSLLAI